MGASSYQRQPSLSEESDDTLTAIIEFKVVSGTWPKPASKAPTLKSGQDGTKTLGCQTLKAGRFPVPAMAKENMSPRTKISSA